MTDENNQYKGRGKIIESGEPKSREQLRRPGNNDFVRSSSASTSSRSTFSLSADAPEFVPRGFSVMPPQTAYAIQPQQMYHDNINGEASLENNTSVDQVRTVIYEMSVDPGEFDTLARYLSDALNASITNVRTLTAVVDEIFEQSVVDSNFRYNGSRLCNYLSNNLALSFGGQSFRSILLNRCKQEFDYRETYASNLDGRTRLRDFAMFMGELFIHLEILKSGVHAKFDILGNTIPDLLDTLLKHSVKEDIKYVCQILKFTGAAMEDLPKHDPTKLNELFEVMKVLASQETIDRTSKDMLTNVIKLRESNWGRGTPTSTPETTHLPQLPTTDPIFYGPDGQPISSEETRFLESDKFLYNDNPEEDGSESEFASQNHLWSSADGMDDEMAEDYEKFLMENS